MNVVVFAGFSGCGKTTLIEQLIPALRQRGLRVSVIKHAHHQFDIDHPGKDSWRHREAGAFEVVVASDRRMALMREHEQPGLPSVHRLLAELDCRVDWVLVEGFKTCNLPKVEVWRAPSADYAERPAQYGSDSFIEAIATDAADRLPAPTGLPVLDVRQPAVVAEWLLAEARRFHYIPLPPDTFDGVL